MGDTSHPFRGVFPRAPAEDQRVQKRVGTEPVAAVHGDTRAFAGRVQALDRGLAVDVRLHAAHDVVVAGLDVDRLVGDVYAGEVAAHVHDLAERLVDALARDDRD